jgi:hypothetical protein
MTPIRILALLAAIPFGRGFRLTKPEDLFAYAVANMLRQESASGRLRAIWTHVPNEVGVDTTAAGAKSASLRYVTARALGLVPGCPDYLFLGRDKSVAVELKAKTGRLNPNQKEFAEWCRWLGVPHHVVKADGVSIAELDASVQKVRALLILEGLILP